MITAFAPTSPADLTPVERSAATDPDHPGHPGRPDLRSWSVTLDELGDLAVDLAVDLGLGPGAILGAATEVENARATDPDATTGATGAARTAAPATPDPTDGAATGGAGFGHPRTHLTVRVPLPTAVSAWPGEELVAQLLAVGVDAVRVDLGAADEATQVGLVGFLVHAESLGLPVSWRMPADATWVAGPDLLHHLPPPDGDTGREVDWRRRHAYGLCYWRHGLTFATVTDLRDPTDAGRFTLSEPDFVDFFTGLDDPRPASSLGAAERAVLDDLLAANLVLLAADHVVRLPFRLRRWPMPLTDLH